MILLTSLGEGTRRYIVDEFTQFGTHILSINKGKATTSGMPGLSAARSRKLTIDDAEALEARPRHRDRGARRLRHGRASSAGDRGRACSSPA